MSVDDLIPFWSACAQIAPVLAVALVIESRLAVRAWAQNAPRWSRIMQGGFYVIAAVGCVAAMMAGLGFLYTGLELFAPVVAASCLGFSAGIVLLLPVVMSFTGIEPRD